MILDSFSLTKADLLIEIGQEFSWSPHDLAVEPAAVDLGAHLAAWWMWRVVLAVEETPNYVLGL